VSRPIEIPLRIVLIGPPAGVRFGIQQGQGSEGRVGAPKAPTGDDLSLTLTVQVKGDDEEGAPRFSGSAVQGPAAGKFVYVNSGTYAGDAGSCWSRRAKVPLSGIGWPEIRQVLGQPGSFLEAKIPGTSKDGGPVCASVKLLASGWRLGT